MKADEVTKKYLADTRGNGDDDPAVGDLKLPVFVRFKDIHAAASPTTGRRCSA